MKKYMVFILMAFLVFSMACSLNDLVGQIIPQDQGDDQSNLAATLSVLETQLAASPQAEAPTVTPPPAATSTPEPTAAPDFEFSYLSFDYHPSLASNVWGEIIPEDNPGEEAFPVHAPEHVVAHFDNYIIGDHFHTPQVRAYPIARYRELSDVAVNNIDYLNQLLTSLSTNEPYYPYLPFVPAAQMINVKIQYIEFDGGRGVRYLTQMGQALYPANNYSIFYTFQGISDNGYYVSVTMPIHHPELLNTGEEVGSDWEPYYDEAAWNAYETEIEAQINGYPDDSFAPSIVLLDDLVRSIKITP